MDNERDTTGSHRTPRVAACICTYRRNEPLRRLLTRLASMAATSADRYDLGVVVVDDNPDGIAETVVREFEAAFPLGVHYRRAGHQNISIGRNLALEAATPLADFIAMTDDDCLPDTPWIDALLSTQAATGADSVSGPMLVSLPHDAPVWLAEQSVFDDEQERHADGAVIALGQTNNCLLSCRWLEAHPDHRFDPEFGRIGGEDMVFFRGAIQRGLLSVHSAAAVVRADEPLEEVTLRALVRSRFWWGNSEAITNLQLHDATRFRVALRGGRRTLRAVLRPIGRLLRLRPPHLRAATIAAARGCGMVVGALGLRVNHH
jgi:succinoglycan biosynthesis protein ExoM